MSEYQSIHKMLKASGRIVEVLEDTALNKNKIVIANSNNDHFAHLIFINGILDSYYVFDYNQYYK